MIPWDYNLAFGIFTIESFLKSFLGENSPYDVELKIGSAMSDAKGMVNYPIDSPTISVEVEERPLVSAILNSEKYRAVYHEYFKKFLDDFFASGKFEELYKHTWNIIHPYVADGQIFYEYEDACRAVEAVHDYCVLREQSIRGQLEGKIPATMEGQRQNWENLVETEGLDLFTSVSFDSLVFGISSKDVIEILDAIAGDNEHNSAGVTKSMEAVKDDSKEIGRIAGRLFSSSGLIKRSLRGVFAGPLALIVSLVALAVGLKIVKKYSRRRPETPVKTGRGDL